MRLFECCFEVVLSVALRVVLRLFEVVLRVESVVLRLFEEGCFEELFECCFEVV